jgi:hypothetical protein
MPVASVGSSTGPPAPCGRSPGAAGATAPAPPTVAASTGIKKASDFPDAVPVASTVWWPESTASAAST